MCRWNEGPFCSIAETKVTISEFLAFHEYKDLSTTINTMKWLAIMDEGFFSFRSLRKRCDFRYDPKALLLVPLGLGAEVIPFSKIL